MKLKDTIIASFLAVLSLTACGKEPVENGQDSAKTAPTEITISDPVPVFPSDPGSYSLKVTAPSRPKLGATPDWLTIKDGVYNAETYQIVYQVTYTGNTGFGDRKAEVVVTAGSLKASVVFTQQGLSLPEVDKSKISKVPVNAHATESAKKLYGFLLDNYGVKTLSGVQSCSAHTNDYVNAVAEVTGKHPALAGYDFLFLQFSPTPASWTWKQDYTDISNQVEHWNAGGIICYMWHWNAPKDEDTFRNNTTGDGNYAFYTRETNFDIREALKENTWQHEFILQDIDEVAYTLKLLQDKGIPVLFRPLHEAAGNYGGGAWFWWGKYGPEYCKQLWNLLQDRLQQYHGLNNIIWVWTVDCKEGKEAEAAQWYPGDDRVDIVGFDVYANDTDAKGMQYSYIDKITNGKKIATVSECGNIPSPKKNLTAGLPWSWFMVWSTKAEGSDAPNPFGYPLNTADYWEELMESDLVITREDMPSLK